MIRKTTAEMLAEAVKASGMTDQEIADQTGLVYSNMVSMMKQGLIRVPLDRIPALAQVLGMDPQTFMDRATREYGAGPNKGRGDPP